MNLTTLRTGLLGEVVEELFSSFENPELFDKEHPICQVGREVQTSVG